MKRQLALTLGLIITSTFILFSSCKKINEATELGGDLIPAVDNITTFETILDVEAYNDLFTFTGTNPLTDDSTLSSYTDEQFLGVISNDPLFGRTEAEMYFELKPLSYRQYPFGNPPDSLHLDSIVLVLDYVETYGDTIIPQTINVFEISSEFRVDTSYLVRRNNYFTTSALLGSTTFKPENLKDSGSAYLDTTKNQLRIRLNDAFGIRLLNYDTTSAGPNNAYYSDSVFKTKLKGFALKSVAGGNAIMGFNLQGASTKLAIYYKDDNNDAPVAEWDTAVAYFPFKPSATYGFAGSASHNYIQRDYSGKPILAAQGGTSPDPIVYIQNTPGSFATLKIPGLGSLNNRVVHRAELIAEQVYDISDSLFQPPTYLFLDAYDPSLTKYLTIPYDLIYDGNSGSYNLGSFGIAPVNALDGSGNDIRTWHFNLSRYVQHVVNNTDSAYDLRLFAPFYIKDQYRPPVPGATALPATINVNPTLAKGRVRLAGGTPGVQRMRLRIIYSKL